MISCISCISCIHRLFGVDEKGNILYGGGWIIFFEPPCLALCFRRTGRGCGVFYYVCCRILVDSLFQIDGIVTLGLPVVSLSCDYC